MLVELNSKVIHFLNGVFYDELLAVLAIVVLSSLLVHDSYSVEDVAYVFQVLWLKLRGGLSFFRAVSWHVQREVNIVLTLCCFLCRYQFFLDHAKRVPLFLQRLHERVEIERIIQVRLLLVLTQIRVPIIREGLLVHELQVIHIYMLSGKMNLVQM